MVRSLPLPLSISQNTRGPYRPAFESATWLQTAGVAVGGMGVLVGGIAVVVDVGVLVGGIAVVVDVGVLVGGIAVVVDMGVLVGGIAVLVEERVFVGTGGVLEADSGVGEGGIGVFAVVLVGGRVVADT